MAVLSLRTSALAALIGCCSGIIDASLWHGRTVYFVVVDRFARSMDDGVPRCVGRGWCGGTLRGLQSKLDYISGMGFDAIWITPVVKQVDWLDAWNGTGYHGYWAADFSRIDPHFGTEEDLLELRQACAKRGMLLMLDVVANHVGPIHSLDQVRLLGPPLNNPSGDQFHQLGRKPGETLKSYIGHPVSVTAAHDCWPNYGTGCNMTVVQEGWFGDLADLKQEDEGTRAYLLKWIRHMVNRYHFDGIRLDTALYMPTWFLEQFQEAAGVYMIGEVVTHNFTFHRSFTPSLSGLLNFPVTTRLGEAFNQSGSLVQLRRLLEQQQASQYPDEHLLGNFIDNHDGARFLYDHGGDVALLRNGLVWTLFYHGIPIVYYGTEQVAVSSLKDERASMWPSFGKTDLYSFIAKLHKLRQGYGLAHGGEHAMTQAVVAAATPRALAFVRGDLLVLVTNTGAGGAAVRLCLQPSSLPPPWAAACSKRPVRNVLGGSSRAQCQRGRLCVETMHGQPAVFALPIVWTTVWV